MNVAAWAEYYRRFWDEAFNRLEHCLWQLQLKEKEKQDGHSK
jgi:hypothetical protein